MRRFLLAIIACWASLPLIAQTVKKPMDYDAFDIWKRITEKAISNDGQWIACEITPWKGDPVTKLYHEKGQEKASFDCATLFRFSWDSKFLIFQLTPPEQTVRELKLKKTKKEDMPLNKLVIYDLVGGVADTVVRLQSVKLPKKAGGCLAWQSQAEKDTVAKNIAGEKIKNNKEDEKTGYNLTVKNLQNNTARSFPRVTDYAFAEESTVLTFITTGNDSLKQGAYRYDPETGVLTALLNETGTYKNAVINKDGSRIAFLFNNDEKNKTGNNFALWFYENGKEAAPVAGQEVAGIPSGWVISEHGDLFFGEKTNRLFFGISPALRQKDTTLLDEERPNVDIWHWQEKILHTKQVVDKPKDLKKNYTAVYDAGTKSIVPLATLHIPAVNVFDEGNGEKALGFSTLPYELESMWLGSGTMDLYLIDVNTGKSTLIKENLKGRPQVSPAFQYIYWYQAADSSWYTYHVATGVERRVTTPQTVRCYDEQNDAPDYPRSYGAAGWLKDDKALLVYDRFDIWRIDPEQAAVPVNLTMNGREKKLSYRTVNFDTDIKDIDPEQLQFLTGTNEATRASGYYHADFRKPAAPKTLLEGDFMLTQPTKAKNKDRLIYTKQTFRIFPDVILSDFTFKKNLTLTAANPQQGNYIWGTVEVVKWTSLDGKPLEGLLYKPENFDPTKKYPMIVNFYERSSEGLHNYRIPQAHRSTIDYHYYISNGYVIFNPDIVYREGYPGEAAFNCIMPGVSMLIDKGFINKDRIGLQGHSWGGYQIAYLLTRTNLFAAAEAGAPVVNMFSAYGGIRWETGLNRSFQYEHTQSRIGASIWEKPLRYLENSPLFAMDKVSTPVLIMANDRDGHVPWYQGIEYFIALRRLGKPAWLLNYNDEPHWPLKYPNMKDFQIRMSQFFHHYLKEEPMPEWMEKGRPAIDKDFNEGYK